MKSFMQKPIHSFTGFWTGVVVYSFFLHNPKNTQKTNPKNKQTNTYKKQTNKQTKVFSLVLLFQSNQNAQTNRKCCTNLCEGTFCSCLKRIRYSAHKGSGIVNFISRITKASRVEINYFQFKKALDIGKPNLKRREISCR